MAPAPSPMPAPTPKSRLKQGMFGIFEVFADTIIICTLTAMVILCSGTPVNYGTAAGAELTISGFTTTYGGWASIFTAVALCCFAFSTIIGWGLYGSRFLVFLCHSDKVGKALLCGVLLRVHSGARPWTWACCGASPTPSTA